MHPTILFHKFANTTTYEPKNCQYKLNSNTIQKHADGKSKQKSGHPLPNEDRVREQNRVLPYQNLNLEKSGGRFSFQ